LSGVSSNSLQVCLGKEFPSWQVKALAISQNASPRAVARQASKATPTEGREPDGEAENKKSNTDEKSDE